MKKFKTASYYIFGVLYFIAGALHFYMPDFYMQIMPAYLPWHLELIYLSGIAEMILGIGLLLPKYRRKAALGLVLLLIAVFPANVYLAFNETAQEALGTNQMGALWIRFPIQALLIGISWWQSRRLID
jgi:uncharacterized membrane protein